MAIIKLQAAEELDFDEACVRASQLLDVNREEFQKAIDIKVNSIKKGLVLSEANRSRKTWTEKGYKQGHSDGEAAGYRRGVDENRITFPCAVCNQELWLPPNTEIHNQVMAFLKEKGWGHGECHGKKA